MILGTFSKQPGEKLDYDIDFSEWIPRGDAITSVAVTQEVKPDNALDTTTYSILTGGKVVKVWVDAGTSGMTYQIQLIATTSGGRKKEVEFKMKVKEV